MGLRVFNRVSRCYLEGAALLVIAGLLGGCSSDFTRFTDGINIGSTTAQYAVVKRPVSRYQQMPPAVQEAVAYSQIENSELPSIPVSNPERTMQVAALGIGMPPPGLGTPPQNLGILPRNPCTLPASEAKSAAGTVNREQRRTYIVQSGDTLFGIARRNDLGVDALKRENGLNSDVIRIGQALTMPGSGVQVANKMRPADGTQLAAAVVSGVSKPVGSLTVTQAKKAVPEAVTQEKVVETVTINPEMKVETVAVPQPQKAVSSVTDTVQKAKEVAIVAPQAAGISSSLMFWPVRGRILSRYGQREGTTTNDGMDIVVAEGTPVQAADSGVVIYAGDGLKEFGNTVLIRHDNNVVTVYGHNGKILVQRGQKVRRGDEIATSGMSGNASTPRLHFEVRKDSTPVNPVKYLEN